MKLNVADDNEIHLIFGRYWYPRNGHMKRDGKLVIITGVTRGLGRALLEGFHEHGYHIAGCGRSRSEIENLQAQFKEDYFDSLDVSDTDQVQAWADRVQTKLGIPDMVINNASIINHPAPLWTVPAAEFKAVVSINIIGPWNVIRAFVPTMIDHDKGIIVNTSSGWGKQGSALFGPYCASKFAIEGMTQSLAEELPSGMAAVAISPGIIDTHMLKIALPETAHLAPSPEDWAKKAVPFLLQLGPKDNGKSLKIPK